MLANAVMTKLNLSRLVVAAPILVAVAALAALALWLGRGPSLDLTLRVPGTDLPPGTEATALTNAVLAGRLLKSDGAPADLRGAWPGFRGADRSGIAADSGPLLRAWGSTGPRELWGIDVGEGYAGAAIWRGRVYVMDYDREKRQDALRCLSLTDGKEIWRFAYPISVKRNHGMSRTVPAVTDKLVVALGPKCHVVCLDAITGELRWGLDLVRQFGATVPPWYAGQCPLLDGGALVLAVGGRSALLVALDPETGRLRWQTPNPKGWKMTHSSVMPMEVAGQRQYVYCADKGVVGVSAKDGTLLWETTDWKISIATIASPVPLEEARLFFSGGYNAGSRMLQLKAEGGRLVPHTLFKLEPTVFGATQHTPIYHRGHLYGVRPDGKFVCLDPSGQVKWTSDAAHQFGLGSFLLADGLIFAMNDSGKLSLLQATPDRFQLLADAQVLQGRESWGPPALADGRLIVRDFTRMVCLEVGRKGE